LPWVEWKKPCPNTSTLSEIHSDLNGSRPVKKS
jgi:hypothetical protein